MSVGFKIKKLREEKKMSQENLASQLGITQSELSKIENGRAKKIDTLFISKVCDFFDKDCAYFINRKNTNNKKESNHNKTSFDIIVDELKKIMTDYEK